METATEAWVTMKLLNGPKNRFELQQMEDSPLEPRTSFYVLRDMEEKGLITSRIEFASSAHREYRLA